ncbi:30S ribosomal protein S20 [Patescibacteria group bacterium]|nr:30S ribosomal protein S20 [Patescibacteria group bacterium]
MPITKRAIKKLAHDRGRQKARSREKDDLMGAVKNARRTPSRKHLSRAMKLLDKAAKHHIIHANKASRLKSRLSKLVKTK